MESETDLTAAAQRVLAAVAIATKGDRPDRMACGYPHLGAPLLWSDLRALARAHSTGCAEPGCVMLDGHVYRTGFKHRDTLGTYWWPGVTDNATLVAAPATAGGAPGPGEEETT